MRTSLEPHIRPLTPVDLDLVLTWRNHPHVRQHMLTQHIISPEEHQAWFAKAQTCDDRHIMLVESGGHAFGLVHFNGVKPQASVEWGFYVAPDAPKGSGQLLGEAALAHAFGSLQIHKLCGQVLASNASSMRFHERLGFSLEGRLRLQVYVETAHQDLICYGLLRNEWLQAEPSRKNA